MNKSSNYVYYINYVIISEERYCVIENSFKSFARNGYLLFQSLFQYRKAKKLL